MRYSKDAETYIDFDVLGDMFNDLTLKADFFGIRRSRHEIKITIRYAGRSRTVINRRGNIMAALFHALGALEELVEAEQKSKEKRVESLDELIREEASYAKNGG